MLVAFFGVGPQDILLLLLVGGMMLLPALIALAIGLFGPGVSQETRVSILKGALQALWTLAVWLVALLVLWLVWYLFGPENRWWTTAIYAAVGAAASFLTIRIWPTKLYGRAPASSDQDQLRTRT